MYRIDIEFNSLVPFNTIYAFNGYYVNEELIAEGVYTNDGYNRQEDEFAVLYGVETDANIS